MKLSRARSLAVITFCLSLLMVLCEASPGATAVQQHQARHWSHVTRLSALGQQAIYPKAALTARGAWVVWMQQKGPGSNYVIMASERHQGGRWSAPTAISPAGQIAESPTVVVDSAGVAVAVWDVMSSSSLPFVQAAYQPSVGGRWSKPMRVSPSGIDAGQASAGIDEKGQAYAVWNSIGRVNRIEAASLRPGHGKWSKPDVLAKSAHELLDPQVAVNAAGRAVAVWKNPVGEGSGSTLTRAQVESAAKLPNRTTWGAPVRLGTEFEPSGQGVASPVLPGPHVSVDAGGEAVAVWQGRSGRTIVPMAATGTGRQWGRPVVLSKAAALYPAVAMDPGGDAAVVWEGPRGQVVATDRPARSRHWAAPKVLNPGGRSLVAYPQIAVGAGGEVIAAWSGTAVEAAVRPTIHDAWDRAVKLGAGGLPQVAISPSGTGIAIWQLPTSKPSGITIQEADNN